MMLDLAILTAADFRSQTGSGFEIHYPDFSERLVLRTVSEMMPVHGHEQRAPFTLRFDGMNREVMLGQATYHLHHLVLGQLMMFLTPVGRHKDGFFHYEAVFT